MLSTEQLAELIKLIQTTRVSGPAPVRRAQRLEHGGTVTITLTEGDGASMPIQVALKDISARGMCFEHVNELPSGTQFVVRLEDSSGKGVSMGCTVVHSRPLANHHFWIGAEFKSVEGEQLVPYERAPEDLISSPARPPRYTSTRLSR